MVFDYSKAGLIDINIDKYIAKVFDDSPKLITGVASSPTTNNLFKVRDNAPKLNKQQAVHFHHMVAQLLFEGKWVKRDIDPTIAFLTMRVKHPDNDDWGKLKRVLKYLNGMRRLHLKLLVDSLTMVKWYIDGSYQTHNDCKGDTCRFMILGKGAICSTSRKKKINTKSSTETELVAVDNLLWDVL